MWGCGLRLGAQADVVPQIGNIAEPDYYIVAQCIPHNVPKTVDFAAKPLFGKTDRPESPKWFGFVRASRADSGKLTSDSGRIGRFTLSSCVKPHQLSSKDDE